MKPHSYDLSPPAPRARPPLATAAGCLGIAVIIAIILTLIGLAVRQ